MNLTPEILEAAYSYFLVTPPFNYKNWRKYLLPPDDVVFSVSAEWISGYFTHNDHAHIVLSSKRVGSTSRVMDIMAHEMIHLLQWVKKTETKGVEHNAEFDRLARKVSSIHGWDYKEFYR